MSHTILYCSLASFVLLAALSSQTVDSSRRENIQKSKKEIILSGNIKRVRPVEGSTMLLIESKGKTIHVDLGPKWYLEKVKLDLQQGDSVSIKGTFLNGRFLANEVNSAGKKYFLRDDMGIPAWEGGGCWFRNN